jgi:phosphoserine phosphatase
MAKQFTVLDFDETLYSKDSLVTFHLFCLLRNPLLFAWLPVQLGGYVLHGLKLISTQQFKNIYILFLSFYSIGKIERLATRFWKKEFPLNFNPELVMVVEENDPVVIITASPLIYFGPLIAKFPGIFFIGTQLKNRNGFYSIDGKNCKGPEKIAAFHKQFGPDAKIFSAYSDSLSDQPLFDAATEAYFVEKGKITLLKK